MSLKNILCVVCMWAIGFTSFSAKAGEIVSDSFESGNMSATNADGFAWDGNNRTAIVTQESATRSVKLFENKVTYELLSDLMPDGSDREYTAKDGKNSLVLRYLAGESWTEQRFDMKAGYPEVWMSYHIRVPLNYSRGLSGASGGSNGKWMMFGMSNTTLFYADDSIAKVVVSDWPSASDGGRGMDIRLQLKSGGKWTPESPTGRDFVTRADAGRWMQVIYHFKASSFKGAGDAVVIMYRKWDDEPAFKYITGLENVNADISAVSVANGYNGWGGGYLLGFANYAYKEETEWLVDDFVISTTSMLPNPPKPPKVTSTTVIAK